MAESARTSGQERPTGAFAEAAAGLDRLQAIDLLRGLVIVLMVLDHVRDFFHFGALSYDAVDPDSSYAALYLTRWVTHLCAPTFVMLAGVSAFLKGARSARKADISWFLLSRGLWLIVLELTVVNFGWTFDSIGNFFQVIWAIGAGMVLLSAAVWLGPRAVLAIGILIVAGHNLLDPIEPQDLGGAAAVWNFAEQAGLARIGAFTAFLAYPAIPWFGIMALGYGLGGVFTRPQPERIRWFLALAAAFLLAFLVLRGLNVYGDPRPWAARADLGRTAMSFFNVNKYPPSLLYDLATLGVAFLLLAGLEKLKGPVASWLLAYGRVPLFVYVLHIYLIHALQMGIGVAGGRAPSDFTNAFADPAKMQGWGFSLAVVYLIWVLVVAALFPLARWFGEVKRRRRDWWLSYL